MRIFLFFSLIFSVVYAFFFPLDIQATENYTSLTLVSGQGASEFRLLRASFPVFSPVSSKNLICNEPSTDLDTLYSPANNLKWDSCHLIKPPGLTFFLPENPFQISFYTYLSSTPTATISADQGKESQLSWNSFLPVIPIIFSYRIKPHSIEEGLDHYKWFNSAHLDRNLSFSSFKRSPDRVAIVTIARSGTHVFANTLEDLIGEFLCMFPNASSGKKKPGVFFLRDLSQGQLKQTLNHYRISVQHILEFKKNIRRIIMTTRHPIELIDSNFRNQFYRNAFFLINGTQGYFSFKKGYQNEPAFFEFVKLYLDQKWMWVRNPIKEKCPVLYATYDDFLVNPERVLCELLTFIDRVSCNISYALPAIKGLLKESLSSSYRKNVSWQSQEELNEKTFKLMDDFGPMIIQTIWEDSDWKNIIRVFGFETSFCQFGGFNDCPFFKKNEGSPRMEPFFWRHNHLTLEKLTKYSNQESLYVEINQIMLQELNRQKTKRSYDSSECEQKVIIQAKELANYIDFSIFDDPKKAKSYFKYPTQSPHPCFKTSKKTRKYK